MKQRTLSNVLKIGSNRPVEPVKPGENASVPHSHTGRATAVEPPPLSHRRRATAVEPPQQPSRTENASLSHGSSHRRRVTAVESPPSSHRSSRQELRTPHSHRAFELPEFQEIIQLSFFFQPDGPVIGNGSFKSSFLFPGAVDPPPTPTGFALCSLELGVDIWQPLTLTSPLSRVRRQQPLTLTLPSLVAPLIRQSSVRDSQSLGLSPRLSLGLSS
ncbi:Tripeptidyl-peptidase [Arachis hypogaea]|nr:Tripeptidyl-peptidase [Arachis hypogaea]